MTRRALATAMTRLGAQLMSAQMLGDAVLEPKHGFVVARRGGMICFSSRRIEAAVFNHVSGYGTFADPTQRGIDAVLRHYARIDGVARFEVLRPQVSRSDIALLERNGFRDGGTLFQCHVRTTTRPPRPRAVAGLSVAPVRPADAMRYAKLSTRGFGEERGQIGKVFQRGWIRQIRRGRPITAFIGSFEGRPAATGVLQRGRLISGLYSGSVLPAYRGRGIQNAMIAARLRYGWALGARSFYSWSDPESASAHNLRDEGFRTRFEVHLFERDGRDMKR